TKELGMSPQEMELAGIPKGYFDGVERAGKGDHHFAMSKADEGDGIIKGQVQRESEPIGAGTEWPVLNERPSPDVVQQLDENAWLQPSERCFLTDALHKPNYLRKWVRLDSPSGWLRSSARAGKVVMLDLLIWIHC
ncbi:MAG TPA: hypothetical protein V6D08_04295, partial [Candidatus Obscuribacterales bacterium]